MVTHSQSKARKRRGRPAASASSAAPATEAPSSSSKMEARAPTPPREFGNAFDDLDAALRAARRAKHSDKKKKMPPGATENPAPATAGPPPEQPEQPSPQVEASALPAPTTPLIGAFHVLAAQTVPPPTDAEPAERIHAVAVSYALLTGAWGTFFGDDNSCLQFLPLRTAEDSRAAHPAHREECTLPSQSMLDQLPAQPQEGGEGRGGVRVRAPAAATDPLDLLLYVNPVGHSFILSAATRLSWAEAVSMANAQHVRDHVFPDLPACLVGKLACVLKTRIFCPPPPPPPPLPAATACGWLSEFVVRGVRAAVSKEEPMELREEGPTCATDADVFADGVCAAVLAGPSQPAVLDERHEGTRWWAPCLPTSEAWARAAPMTGRAAPADWSPAVTQVVDGEGEGSGGSGALAEHGEVVDCRWLVPHLVRAACTRENRSDGPVCGQCQLTLGNVIFPYPANAFYNHPDEIY